MTAQLAFDTSDVGDPDPERRHQQGPRGDRTYPHWQMSARFTRCRTITASGYFPDEARAQSWIRLTIAHRYGDCDGVRFTVKQSPLPVQSNPERKTTT